MTTGGEAGEEPCETAGDVVEEGVEEERFVGACCCSSGVWAGERVGVDVGGCGLVSANNDATLKLLRRELDL